MVVGSWKTGNKTLAPKPKARLLSPAQQFLADVAGPGVDVGPFPVVAFRGADDLGQHLLAEAERIGVEAAAEDAVIAGIDRGAELIDLFRRIGRDFMIIAERSAAEEPNRQGLELIAVLLGEIARLRQPPAHVNRATEDYGRDFDVPHRRIEVAKLGRASQG